MFGKFSSLCEHHIEFLTYASLPGPTASCWWSCSPTAKCPIQECTAAKWLSKLSEAIVCQSPPTTICPTAYIIWCCSAGTPCARNGQRLNSSITISRVSPSPLKYLTEKSKIRLTDQAQHYQNLKTWTKLFSGVGWGLAWSILDKRFHPSSTHTQL